MVRRNGSLKLMSSPLTASVPWCFGIIMESYTWQSEMESLLQCQVTQGTVSGFWIRIWCVCLAVTMNCLLYGGQFQDAIEK